MSRFVIILIAVMTSCLAQGQVITGTGFFVSPNGHFATNWHVVQDASEIVVLDNSGTQRKAQIVARDPANDLAVLKIEGKTIAWLPIIDSTVGIRRGTDVITVGYPRIGLQGHEPKVTNGIVSSLSGVGDDPRLFQVSVPVQPGNSGGALVTYDGLVIGVVTSKLSAIATLKTTGTLPEGVNYAVKSNYLLELLRSHTVQARIDTRRSGKSMSLVVLTEQVERATGLILARDDTKPVQPVVESKPVQSAKVDCLIKSDCSANEWCTSGKCVPLKKFGESCALSMECSDGLWCSSYRCISRSY